MLEQHVQQNLEWEPARGRQSNFLVGWAAARQALARTPSPNPNANPDARLGLHHANNPKPLLTMASAPCPARNAASALRRAEPDCGDHALSSLTNQRLGTEPFPGLRRGSRMWYRPPGGLDHRGRERACPSQPLRLRKPVFFLGMNGASPTGRPQSGLETD